MSIDFIVLMCLPYKNVLAIYKIAKENPLQQILK